MGGWIEQVTKEAKDTPRHALGLPEAAAPPTPLKVQAYDELCFPELGSPIGRTDWASALRQYPDAVDSNESRWRSLVIGSPREPHRSTSASAAASSSPTRQQRSP
ncbi:hypothetical protein [Mycobacterium uberis]|uniref:hypothetical protein n=1 Tax=Mycobacterium uberis TaxID=2162698 RepID=UPI001058E8EE|nr:hypothetical protein [Mycobacterium uberis]